MDPLTLTHKKADLLIKNGCIEQILPESFDLLTSPEFSQEAVIDADGLIVAPGLIDTHIHFRDPGFTYKEDLHTGALSAAKGGVTTVICMANTSPTVDPHLSGCCRFPLPQRRRADRYAGIENCRRLRIYRRRNPFEKCSILL